MNQTLRLRIILPVDPSAVYQAITNASSLQKWLTEMARASERGLPRAIKILELEPDHKLSYSWRFEEETVVTWVLQDSEGGTRLTLVHSGFGKDRSTISCLRGSEARSSCPKISESLKWTRTLDWDRSSCRRVPLRRNP